MLKDFDFDEIKDVEACGQDNDIWFGTYQRMCRFGGGGCCEANSYTKLKTYEIVILFVFIDFHGKENNRKS